MTPEQAKKEAAERKLMETRHDLYQNLINHYTALQRLLTTASKSIDASMNILLDFAEQEKKTEESAPADEKE